MGKKIKYLIIIVLVFVIFIVYRGTKDKEKNEYIEAGEKQIEVIETIIEEDGAIEHVEKQEEEFAVPLETVTIAFGGDILMDGYFADYIKSYGVDYSWTDIEETMKAADLSVVNLETSVSNGGSTKKPVGYGFRSEPYTLEGLVNAGIDLVSTANNHILDYGRDALVDTLDNLEEYNIVQSGSGRNIEEAQELVIMERGGIKFGFMSYNTIIPWDDWEAGEEIPGPARLGNDNKDSVIDLVKYYDEKCDVLVFMVHWGVEYSEKPEEWQSVYARELIDAGVDTVIGHHPHVLQGMEIYRDKPIFYSIGNFIFLKMNEDAGHTGIFELKYTKEGFVKGVILPVHISACKANLLKKEDELYNNIIDKFSKRSEIFHTSISDDGEFSVHEIE